MNPADAQVLGDFGDFFGLVLCIIAVYAVVGIPLWIWWLRRRER